MKTCTFVQSFFCNFLHVCVPPHTQEFRERARITNGTAEDNGAQQANNDEHLAVLVSEYQHHNMRSIYEEKTIVGVNRRSGPSG